MHAEKLKEALHKYSLKQLCVQHAPKRPRDSNVFTESTLLPACDEPDQLVAEEYGHRLAIRQPKQMHRLPSRWLQDRASSCVSLGNDWRLASHTVELRWRRHAIVEPTICDRLQCVWLSEVEPRHATVVLDNSPSSGNWVLLRDG